MEKLSINWINLVDDSTDDASGVRQNRGFLRASTFVVILCITIHMGGKTKRSKNRGKTKIDKRRKKRLFSIIDREVAC